MKKSVSVILPNYNGEELLSEYLPITYHALTKSKCISSYEVIVVDDGSEDNSVSFVKAHYPEIVLLEQDQNRGFSETINRGIFAATKELVFVLNTDMAVADNIFDTLIPFFEEEDTFGVNCTIKDERGKSILEGQKLPVHKFGRLLMTDNMLQTKVAYTFYLCGGNSLMDREKLMEIGGYNEIYSPFYVEDVDLSLHAWSRGWKCYYTPKSYCLHRNSATVDKYVDGNYKRIIVLRNTYLLSYIFTEGRARVKYLCYLSFKLIFGLLFGFFGGNAQRHFLAIKGVYKVHNSLFKRRAAQKALNPIDSTFYKQYFPTL